jgi:hypothetical protein
MKNETERKKNPRSSSNHSLKSECPTRKARNSLFVLPKKFKSGPNGHRENVPTKPRTIPLRVNTFCWSGTSHRTSTTTTSLSRLACVEWIILYYRNRRLRYGLSPGKGQAQVGAPTESTCRRPCARRWEPSLPVLPLQLARPCYTIHSFKPNPQARPRRVAFLPPSLRGLRPSRLVRRACRPPARVPVCQMPGKNGKRSLLFLFLYFLFMLYNGTGLQKPR